MHTRAVSPALQAPRPLKRPCWGHAARRALRPTRVRTRGKVHSHPLETWRIDILARLLMFIAWRRARLCSGHTHMCLQRIGR